MNTLTTILEETFGENCVAKMTALMAPIEMREITDEYIAYANDYAAKMREAMSAAGGGKVLELMVAIASQLPGKSGYSAEEAALLVLSGVALSEMLQTNGSEVKLMLEVYEQFSSEHPFSTGFQYIEGEMQKVGALAAVRPGVLELAQEMLAAVKEAA